MARIRFTIDTTRFNGLQRRLRRGLSRKGVDGVMARVASVTHGRLVRQTPKKWTGQTRRGWTIVRARLGSWTVLNRSKIMVFLEKGTKAHGPVKAKALFIPLTRRAFNAGPRGVMARNRAALSAGRTPPFVIGRDFIFAKKVKGIRASNVVRNYVPLATNLAKAAIRQHIRGLLRG